MPGLVPTYAWLAILLAGSPSFGLPAAGSASAPVTVTEAAAPEVAAPAPDPATEPDSVPEATPATRRRPTQPDAPRRSPISVAPANQDPANQDPADQDPEAILRATAAAYESMHSVAADFTQVIRNTLLGRTTESMGTLYQKEPDKFLMDFSDPAGDKIVSDGRYFWMYFPSVDPKQVIRTTRRGQGLDLQAQFIGDPVERFDYTYQGTETFRGRQVHVFTLVPREPTGYREMKAWIDADDHLVRQFELREENGNVRHMELRDVVVNPVLPDTMFEFTPPAGAIVVERG